MLTWHNLHQTFSFQASSSDEEDSPRSQPRGQFRRRVIESNWTRYEEEPEEEDDKVVQEVKVAEFQRLLSARSTYFVMTK